MNFSGYAAGLVQLNVHYCMLHVVVWLGLGLGLDL